MQSRLGIQCISASIEAAVRKLTGARRVPGHWVNLPIDPTPLLKIQPRRARLVLATAETCSPTASTCAGMQIRPALSITPTAPLFPPAHPARPILIIYEPTATGNPPPETTDISVTSRRRRFNSAGYLRSSPTNDSSVRRRNDGARFPGKPPCNP